MKVRRWLDYGVDVAAIGIAAAFAIVVIGRALDSSPVRSADNLPIAGPVLASPSTRTPRYCTRLTTRMFATSRRESAWPCFRVHRLSPAIMDRPIPTITGAPTPVAPMSPIGTACPTPAGFTAIASAYGFAARIAALSSRVSRLLRWTTE